MTPANAPQLARHPDQTGEPFIYKLDLLQDDRVRYANQPIAVVIAETLEAATEGAALLRAVLCSAEPARVGLDAAERFVPASVGVGEPPDAGKGDVAAGLAAADKRIEADLRDRRAISQRHGTACGRRAVGRRQLVARHAKPGDVDRAAPARRAVRHRSCRHPYPQPVPRRRFWLQGRAVGAAGAWRHGGSAGRPPGQAGDCGASRCSARSAIERKPGRPCGWAPTRTAS